MNPDLVNIQLDTFYLITIKLLAFILTAILLAFALVVVRQVQMVTRVLQTERSHYLKIIAWAHVVLAVLGLIFLLIAV